MTQTLDNIKQLLSNTKFTLFDQRFQFLSMEKGDGFLIQLECWMKCNVHSQWGWQKGGKYYISSHAINDEVVLTAWKACQGFIIHEARETFTYKNQTIFQPHYDIEELVEFCETARVSKRPHNLIAEHIQSVQIAQDIDT